MLCVIEGKSARVLIRHMPTLCSMPSWSPLMLGCTVALGIGRTGMDSLFAETAFWVRFGESRKRPMSKILRGKQKKGWLVKNPD